MDDSNYVNFEGDNEEILNRDSDFDPEEKIVIGSPMTMSQTSFLDTPVNSPLNGSPLIGSFHNNSNGSLQKKSLQINHKNLWNKKFQVCQILNHYFFHFH